ncbi:adenylate/guanylate cyclase domain-containing protein [Microvirga massiliensis]|uniref:adenylate/guanylate cyclase domain-containing protein n=1 Tax=Microvirga massiliensis TaxID=1033741 RepID=UPI00062B6227|nr:adenylate/guanylate cyclase domain-containing protein [Microvirga massiliensis]
MHRHAAQGQPVERKLAAILAADVVEYSRLMGADEAGTLARLKALRKEIIDPRITRHRGRTIKLMGDGALVEFPSVVEAVECAVEIQAAVAARNTGIPADQQIRFRIGINVGDIILDGKDIYGDGVNVAARLEGLAEPGGICISRVVRDQVRDKVPYTFADLGEQAVKNIARPVRAYRIVFDPAALPTTMQPESKSFSPRVTWIAAAILLLTIAGGSWWLMRTSQPPAPASAQALPRAVEHMVSTAGFPQGAPAPSLSIVVLPFANLSGDPEQDYFVDGITEDLTTDLSRIDGSFVIARSTAYTYKGKAIDVRQIGRELGVRYVLEGSVRRTGEQVRVNAQLIDAASGAHVWADRFDSDRAELAAMQNEITGRIAASLSLTLVEAEGHRVEREHRTNPDALDYTLRGRATLFKPGAHENNLEAARLFEQALKLDPTQVEALVFLADALVSDVLDFWSASPAENLARAEALLDRALTLDSNRATAHHAKGLLLQARGRFDEAANEFRMAIALDRNLARSYRALGQMRTYVGHPEEAAPYLLQAMRLSPRDHSLGVMQFHMGYLNLVLGNDDAALEWLPRARSTNPEYSYIHLTLAAEYGLRGDPAAAQAALAEAIKRNPRYRSIAGAKAVMATYNNPLYVAQRERVYEGLRRAGLPDE